jgi:hypothetical protein
MFRSSNQRGFSPAIANDPRRVDARKLELEVMVRFTSTACTIQTPEGTVHAQPGDAILVGLGGEQWRVSKAHFDNKYRPVPPTVLGTSGRYLSLRNHVMALPMTEQFEVVLADGISRLVGQPGDWLVDYGDGSLGIVSAGIFNTTYEITG